VTVSTRVQPLPAAPPATPHLQVQGLGFARGERWLFRDLDLTLPRGRFLAVVGPSGVGKSTFLSCLAGLIAPSTGKITFCCQHQGLHDPTSYRRHTGVVFQNFLLVPTATVLTNALCGRLGRYAWWQTLLGFPARDRRAAFALLDDLGLAPHTHRWSGETSGGEQQRTALARALWQEPELILADEPVSQLDSYLTGRVLGRLRLEADRRGCTVICVLHQAELVERFADLVLSFDPMRPGNWKIREARR
jgi:phosphonate transport system ATP-binding protein